MKHQKQREPRIKKNTTVCVCWYNWLLWLDTTHTHTLSRPTLIVASTISNRWANIRSRFHSFGMECWKAEIVGFSKLMRIWYANIVIIHVFPHTHTHTHHYATSVIFVTFGFQELEGDFICEKQNERMIVQLKFIAWQEGESKSALLKIWTINTFIHIKYFIRCRLVVGLGEYISFKGHNELLRTHRHI